MKKNLFSKLLAVFLTLLMLSQFSFAFAAESEIKIEKNVPQVNVVGLFGTTVYENTDNVKSNVRWPISDGRFLNLIQKESDPMIKSLLTLNGDFLEKILIPELKDLFAPFALNSSGELDNKTGIDFIWPAKSQIKKDSCLDFYYDWRLDPFETADELARFIDYVLEASGCEKIALSAHSCGGVITNAYLAKYGCEKLQSVFFVSSAGQGTTFLGELMSGDFTLKGDSIENFLKYLFMDSEYENLKAVAFSLLNRTGVADALLNLSDSAFSKAYQSLLNDFLIPLFGTWPTMWAMVPDEYIDAAENYVFEHIFKDDGNDYSGLIEKIENYRVAVREKRTEILLKTNKNCNLGVFSCYGYSAIPVSSSWYCMTDGVVDTKYTSLGATTAKYGKTLGSSYLASADKNSISPDQTIDASTCLFPKQTWFVKNYRHKQFHDDLYALMDAVLYSKEQMTVDTYEKYPQFLRFDNVSGIIPDQRKTTPEEEKRETFIDAIVEFFELMAKWFRKIFNI